MSDFMIGAGGKTISSGSGSVSTGTTITSSASADTMGTIVELIASTSVDAVGITISTTEASASANAEWLMDILIGASTEEPLVEGLLWFWDSLRTIRCHNTWFFPVHVPKGSRIAAQVQNSNAAADSVDIVVQLHTGSFESGPGYGKIVSLGMDYANSTSSIIPDGGAVANTQGTPVQIEASCPGYEGFSLSMGVNADFGRANASYLIEIKIDSSTPQVLVPDIYSSETSGELHMSSTQWFPIKIPEGSALYVSIQSTSTNATDRIKSIIFHGAR